MGGFVGRVLYGLLLFWNDDLAGVIRAMSRMFGGWLSRENCRYGRSSFKIVGMCWLVLYLYQSYFVLLGTRSCVSSLLSGFASLSGLLWNGSHPVL